MEGLGLSDVLQGVVRARVEHTNNQLWARLNAGLRTAAAMRGEYYNCEFTMTCPPNLVLGFWNVVLGLRYGDPRCHDPDRVVQNCGIELNLHKLDRAADIKEIMLDHN